MPALRLPSAVGSALLEAPSSWFIASTEVQPRSRVVRRRARCNRECHRGAMDAPRVQASLGEHFAVLEASLEGLTARQIADTKGWGRGKAGERKAVAAQDNALEALAALEQLLAA